MWLWGGVVLTTALMAVPMHRSSLEALFDGEGVGGRFENQKVGRDTLRLPTALAEDFRGVELAVRLHVPENEPLLVLPYRTVYYPLLSRQAPTWGIYFLRPSQGESDAELIRKLEEKGVDWVLLTGEKLVGVPPFSEVRPEVMAYLTAEFLPVSARLLPAPHLLLHRRR